MSNQTFTPFVSGNEIDADAITNACQEFDRLAEKFGEDRAKAAVWEKYGSGIYENVMNQVYSASASVVQYTGHFSPLARHIRNSLEEAAERKLTFNRPERIKRIIKTFNENLSKCHVTVKGHCTGGRELVALEPHEVNALRIQQDGRKQDLTAQYAAFASSRIRGKMTGLEFDILDCE
jgi:hypothetical protein